jgi:hypothetical protein
MTRGLDYARAKPIAVAGAHFAALSLPQSG